MWLDLVHQPSLPRSLWRAFLLSSRTMVFSNLLIFANFLTVHSIPLSWSLIKMLKKKASSRLRPRECYLWSASNWVDLPSLWFFRPIYPAKVHVSKPQGDCSSKVTVWETVKYFTKFQVNNIHRLPHLLIGSYKQSVFIEHIFHVISLLLVCMDTDKLIYILAHGWGRLHIGCWGAPTVICVHGPSPSCLFGWYGKINTPEKSGYLFFYSVELE